VVAVVSLVVELCGLPGAGKSSLAREVLASAPEGDVHIRVPTEAIGPEVPTVRRIGRKLRLVTGETVRQPVPSADAMRRIVGSGQGGVGPISSRWVQWVTTQRLMAVARRTPGVHLFDEGVTQALWSLGLRGDPSSTLAALRRTVGRWDHPDRIIVLDPPIELIDRRLSERGSRHSRLQDVADATARRAELTKGKELLDRLIDWWIEVLPSDVTITRMGEDACSSRSGGGSGLLATITGRPHASGVEIEQIAPERSRSPDVGELRHGPGVSRRSPG
jgi:AAA domain